MVPPYYSYYRRRYFEKPLFIGTLLAVCLRVGWPVSSFLSSLSGLWRNNRYTVMELHLCAFAGESSNLSDWSGADDWRGFFVKQDELWN